MQDRREQDPKVPPWSAQARLRLHPCPVPPSLHKLPGIARSTDTKNPKAHTQCLSLYFRPPEEAGTAGSTGGAGAGEEEAPTTCLQRPSDRRPGTGPRSGSCRRRPSAHPSSETQSIPPLRSASLSASLPKRSSISAIPAYVHLSLGLGGGGGRRLLRDCLYGTEPTKRDSVAKTL